MLTQYIEKLHIYVLNSKKRFWSSHNNATAAKLDVATIPNLIIWLLLLTKRKEDTVTLALPVPVQEYQGRVPLEHWLVSYLLVHPPPSTRIIWLFLHGAFSHTPIPELSLAITNHSPF